MAGILRPFHTDKMWGHEDTAPSSRKFDKTGSKDGEIGVGKYSELETRMSWSSSSCLWKRHLCL